MSNCSTRSVPPIGKLKSNGTGSMSSLTGKGIRGLAGLAECIYYAHAHAHVCHAHGDESFPKGCSCDCFWQIGTKFVCFTGMHEGLINLSTTSESPKANYRPYVMLCPKRLRPSCLHRHDPHLPQPLSTSEAMLDFTVQRVFSVVEGQQRQQDVIIAKI